LTASPKSYNSTRCKGRKAASTRHILAGCHATHIRPALLQASAGAPDQRQTQVRGHPASAVRQYWQHAQCTARHYFLIPAICHQRHCAGIFPRPCSSTGIHCLLSPYGRTAISFKRTGGREPSRASQRYAAHPRRTASESGTVTYEAYRRRSVTAGPTTCPPSSPHTPLPIPVACRCTRGPAPRITSAGARSRQSSPLTRTGTPRSFIVDDTDVENPRVSLFAVRSLLDPVPIAVRRIPPRPAAPRHCATRATAGSGWKTATPASTSGAASTRTTARFQRDCFVLRRDGSIEGDIDANYPMVTKVGSPTDR
jgi:hypothetical protein